MIKMLAAVAAAAGFLAVPSASANAAGSLLEDGAYAVEVQLEMPHLEDLNYKKDATLCLRSTAGADNHGFRILSDNNPLTTCPMQNVHQDGETLTFDIKCRSTSNLAKAKAVYTLSANAFRGRIDMTMAGKNMTMTEVQAGHRVGPCKGSNAPS